MKEIDSKQLRELVQKYLQRHHYEAAVFWGDKLVSLTEGPEDVYWLAQAYLATGQYHRACLLISSHGLTSNGSLCYLSAYCHFQAKEYSEALTLLEDSAWADEGRGFTTPLPALDALTPLEASRQLLRARLYEATDNPGLATECYQSALAADPYCYDALRALTRHQLLSAKEERALVAGLPGDQLLHTCYATQLSKCARDHLPKELSFSEAELEQSTASNTTLPPSSGASGALRGLHKLPSALAPLDANLDILTARAEVLYYKCSFVACFRLTSQVLERDPYHTDCLPVHIGCLVELQQPNALFLLAHRLVELYPDAALSWYAVGTYYLLIRRHEHARRHLAKATSLDKMFGLAWIAYAHSFAVEKEHDQASAAYFKAFSLMKGCHLPSLYIGMEYSLTNNAKIAQKYIQRAVDMVPEDPFALHEYGLYHFSNQQYGEAEKYLRRAVDIVLRLYGSSGSYYNIPAKWATLYNNLGHTVRKQGRTEEALDCHYEALRLQPSHPPTLTAVALCLATAGRLQRAVDVLHDSLSLQRDQTVAVTMLTTLMEHLALLDHVAPPEEDESHDYAMLERLISGSVPPAPPETDAEERGGAYMEERGGGTYLEERGGAYLQDRGGSYIEERSGGSFLQERSTGFMEDSNAMAEDVSSGSQGQGLYSSADIDALVSATVDRAIYASSSQPSGLLSTSLLGSSPDTRPGDESLLTSEDMVLDEDSD